MDENITPEPGADDAARSAAGETPPPPPPPGSHEQPGPRVTGTEIRDVARLRRSSTDKHIAGVAGGLARHLDVDPLLVRIGFVVLAFFGGAGVLLYGALWLLVPEETDDHAVVTLDDRNRTIAVVLAGGIALLVFLSDALGGIGAHDRDGVVFPVVPVLVVGLIVWLVMRRRERRFGGGVPPVPGAATDPRAARTAFDADVKANPEKYKEINAWQYTGTPQTGYRWVRDPRKRGPLLFWIVVPLIALVLGTLGVFDLAGYGVEDAAYPALALAIVAGGLLLGSFWGRAGGLILLGLILTPVTAIATVAHDFEGKTVSYAPTTVAQIPADGYHFDGAGELTVDLSNLTDPELLDGRTIDIDMAVGEMTVIVPDQVDVTARAWAHGPGGYEVFGENGGGIDSQLTHTLDVPDEKAELSLDAGVSVGKIIVRSK